MDANSTIRAIDSGMDVLDSYQATLDKFLMNISHQIQISETRMIDLIDIIGSQLSATQYLIYEEERLIMNLYDELNSEDANRFSIYRQINEHQQILFEYQCNEAKLESKLTKGNAVQINFRDAKEVFYPSMSNSVQTADVAISRGMRMCAGYLQGISALGGGGAAPRDERSGSGSVSDGHYAVVIIDSEKYPESAAHIRQAQRAGAPERLTLDRDGAVDRRAQSLRGVPIRSGYDRDEYPPAAFSEGGNGANIRYIAPSDNQGSGSSFGHQLSNFPDGTTVRFRVV